MPKTMKDINSQGENLLGNQISPKSEGHFESKMATKVEKSSDLGEIWFPSRLCCCELYQSLVCYGGHFESKTAKIQKSSDLGEIWFPSRFSPCELISFIVFGIGSHVMILQITSYLVIIIIILETKFRPYRRIFLLWWPFWIQNGHYSQSKWSPYGAACLTSCKYPFPLKSYNF
jgi:hypothetical protein